jgi:predicted Fe-Mo cluster-binding NifX family protein
VVVVPFASSVDKEKGGYFDLVFSFFFLVRRGIKKKGGKQMKLCIPTLGNGGLDDIVSEHFGRAPTFTVVDMVNNKVEIVQNTGEHFGGVGNTPDLVAGAGAEVMLCSGLGPRAISAFEQLGIEVYVGASGTVNEAIRAFQAGELTEVSDADACKMHRH